MLAGEAGIGKSRLMREAKTIAAEIKITTYQGNCYEQDRSLPFAPFVDLLRKNLSSLNGESVWPQLLKLAPDLALEIPNIQLAAVDEPEQEKRNLIRAWLTLLTDVSRPNGQAQAKVLILEDLHWCDDVSLELLLQLARAAATRPLLLLLTYRSDEVTPALSHMLAQLDRERLAHEISLKPLSGDHIAAMIGAIFKQASPVSPDFVNAINELAEGNPFFVEEILKSLVESGDIYFANGRWTRKPTREIQVPRTVQVAVMQRARQLNSDRLRVLQFAAILGQRFDFAILQILTSLDETSLVTRLRELVDVQLIVENSADEFAFRHALTRQAVYAAMLKRERRSLHRIVGEVLEKTQPNGKRDSALSYHFYEAEAWEKTLELIRKLPYGIK